MKKILLILAVLVATFLLFLKISPAPYYVSICAIFRNEAPFLREWIEYHRLIGVDHFYLYNNLSDDSYADILKPYIDQGIVELTDWPHQAVNQKTWTRIQCRAYTDALKKTERTTTWLAIIDTDEFILPLEKKDLKSFLKEYEGYSGIGINWQLYGTSGVKKIPPGKTLIGTLTKKAPEDFTTNKFVKSIVQPKRVKKIKQPHYCYYKKPFFHVTENKDPFPLKSLTSSVSVKKIRINHYTYRDEDFFYHEKRRRHQEWFPQSSPAEMNPAYNLLEDDSILAYVPELEKKLFTDGTTASHSEKKDSLDPQEKDLR